MKGNPVGAIVVLWAILVLVIILVCVAWQSADPAGYAGMYATATPVVQVVDHAH